MLAAMSPTVLSRPVLVLDAGFQPVNVINLKRAVAMICAGKAVVLLADDALPLRAEKLVLHCPRVIRLLIACAHKAYRRLRWRLTKRNIMARDEWRCQYCGATDRPLTIDHVVPRARFTRDAAALADSWENCVTACLVCNARKGNRTPAEAGMALLNRPHAPQRPLIWRERQRGQEAELDAWRPYLGWAG